MSQKNLDRLKRWLRPMQPRDPHEGHRAVTPLELFFDLCFVAAVSLTAQSLHHGLTEAHIAEGIVRYCTTFFAIWWAWMNFTWFASAYDTDDGPYRLLTFLQMAGALVLAAGVPQAFETGDFAIMTIGYVIMRIAMITQWTRAARNDPMRSATAYRYAAGLALIQAGWVALLAVPLDYRLIGFFLLVAIELAIPIWAEQVEVTPWHPEHIAERYGLFTLIVLGESVISTTRAFQIALDEGQSKTGLLGLAIAALVIVFSCWWLYFDRQTEGRLTSLRRAFIWGYGHWFIFAALAASGAGLAAAVDFETHHSHLDAVETGFTVAVPVAIYVLSIWFLQVVPYETGRAQAVFLIAAALILLSPLAGLGVYLVAALMAVLVVLDMLTQPGALFSGEDEPA